MAYRRIAALKTAEALRDHLASLGTPLDFDEEVEAGADSPMAQPIEVDGTVIGNRFCILPMEGWDGTLDGRPTELTTRRWTNFGISGAKLIWGGEAVAVRHDGRANPNQLMINDETVGDLAALRETLVQAHEEHVGGSDDLSLGLQLTHSGRFARPNEKTRLEPRILYHHPILDRKFQIPEDYPLMTDGEIGQLIQDFVKASALAAKAGFSWVDIKHCHGYLGHEFLSATTREGKYGGSFENRTRFLRDVVAGIRTEVPQLGIGVRLSAFDLLPYKPGEDGTGEPEVSENGGYVYGFGGDGTGRGIDLTEPKRFLDLLAELGIRLVCISCGSPYYNPHIQRPAYFPPSDGYQPPEDPLVGVARQIAVTAELRAHRSDLVFVGSGYTYLQEWLPNVAQNVIRTGKADFVGLGRMVLSYPRLPADVLAGKALDRRHICRTFSDCTTAPRHGMVSGCFPLDEFYKNRPESERVKEIKSAAKS